jgi:hypothetical protein
LTAFWHHSRILLTALPIHRWFGGLFKNFKNLKRGTAQAGYFGNDNFVTFPGLLQNFPYPAFAPGLASAFGIFNNRNWCDLFLITITKDAEFLVLNVLGVF